MNEEPERYQIGRDGDTYTVVDTVTGWVKGPYSSLWRAERALSEIERGLDEPPQEN